VKFDVHVVDDEQRSQSGCCVDVDLPESFPLAPGDGRITAYTDENGNASFEMTGESFGEVTIHVDGDNKGRFELEEGAGLTIVV
jgi:hypothetical protein